MITVFVLGMAGGLPVVDATIPADFTAGIVAGGPGAATASCRSVQRGEKRG
ncbi:MAG: hypothetical protein ABFD97_11780 [Syntrophobacter sp.]